MATGTKGICFCCGAELGKTAMKNHILKQHCAEEDGQDCYVLKIEGAYDKDYWLYIDVPLTSALSTVDSFLRKIWLECCGHMSAFSDKYCDEYSMSRKLGAFSVGDTLRHEYDFGSTTETLITFVASTRRKKQRAAVRLLARNVAPVFACKRCGAPAAFIDQESIYRENPFYCEECAKKEELNNMLLPVTNSPRMGVCGYCGEQDVFTYSGTDAGKQEE